MFGDDTFQPEQCFNQTVKLKHLCGSHDYSAGTILAQTLNLSK